MTPERSPANVVTPTVPPAHALRDPRKLVFALVGVVATGLGAVGVFVPGLPTTVFVIIAAWCFTRSCPWLEQRLLRNRLFAPAMAIIDGDRPFTTRMRVISLGCMWISGGIGLWLVARSTTNMLGPGAIALALVIGTIAILRYKRGRGTR